MSVSDFVNWLITRPETVRRVFADEETFQLRLECPAGASVQTVTGQAHAVVALEVDVKVLRDRDLTRFERGVYAAAGVSHAARDAFGCRVTMSLIQGPERGSIAVSLRTPEGEERVAVTDS